MKTGVLTVLEVGRDDGVAVSPGLTAAARRLAASRGGHAALLLLGDDSPGKEALYHTAPADRLFVLSSGAEEEAFALASHAAAIIAAGEQVDAGIFLFAQSLSGRELAGIVAAKLDASLLTDAQAFAVAGERITVTAVKLGGTAIIDCSAPLDRPVVILALAAAFNEASESGSPEVVTITAPESKISVGARVLMREERREAALDEAEIIVSGGRGLGGPEPFTGMLADLASELGGAVGASRAVVDAGWVPHSRQIGQTGKTVRPRLYIAVAISGAIQHRVGMQTAGTIIALNKEAQVPIGEFADLLIVGDAFAVVPELTRLLREEKGHS